MEVWEFLDTHWMLVQYMRGTVLFSSVAQDHTVQNTKEREKKLKTLHPISKYKIKQQEAIRNTSHPQILKKTGTWRYLINKELSLDFPDLFLQYMWVLVFQRKCNPMQYLLPEQFRFEIQEYHLVYFTYNTDTLE